MKNHIYIIWLTFLLTAIPAHAEVISQNYSEPTPFGLHIGHDAQPTLAQSLEMAYIGENSVTLGDMYVVDVAPFQQPHLLRLTIIFDQDQLLQAVLAEYDRMYFPELYQKMKKLCYNQI